MLVACLQGEIARSRSWPATTFPCPSTASIKRELLQAAESGVVPIEVLNRSVTRLLGLVSKAIAHRNPGHPADLLTHHELAQRIARASIVLLKNEDDLLPIDLNRPQKLLVAGACAVTSNTTTDCIAINFHISPAT